MACCFRCEGCSLPLNVRVKRVGLVVVVPSAYPEKRSEEFEGGVRRVAAVVGESWLLAIVIPAHLAYCIYPSQG